MEPPSNPQQNRNLFSQIWHYSRTMGSITLFSRFFKTKMGKEKNLGKKEFISTINGKKISGYEIHLGITSGSDCNNPFATLSNKKDGAISSNGLVMGTYLHGLF